MDNMFKDASTLKSVIMKSDKNCEISSMIGSFQNCVNLKTVEISGFNTEKLTSIKRLFSGTKFTEIDFSKINIKTDKVVDISQLFENCTSLLTVNIGELKTSKVTDMSNLFYGCASLKSIDLSKLTTSNVVNFSGMFANCKK